MIFFIEFFSFADDTTILILDQTVNSLYCESNNILNIIYTGFCMNKFKLNLLKSKFIRFELYSSNILTDHT